MEWLVASRVAQGAGAALVMPLAVALLNAQLFDDRRGRALGIFEGLTGLATIAGPPVGGSVAYLVGWRWVFWVNVPIALLIIQLVRARISEGRGSYTALDLRGMALVTGGCLGLVWGLVRGNESGWGSVEVTTALALGAVLLLAFVGWERQSAEPMLPLRLLGNRIFTAATVISFLLYAALYGTVFFLSQYMQVGLGYSALETALRLIPWTATLLAVASPETSYAALLVPLVVAGIGTSMAIPVVQSAMLGALPVEDIGKVSGVNGVSQELGGVFGVAISVALFTAVGSYTSATAFADGFVVAMGACVVFSLEAAAAAVALRASSASRRIGSVQARLSERGSSTRSRNATPDS